MADTKNTRSSRESGAHDNQARRKVGRPVRKLEAPPAPPGYVYRWIRESMLGTEDRANVSRRLREGWELVRADEHPEFDAPVIDEGKNAGVIGVGGLVLARIPEEIAEQRNKHYQNVAQNQMDAVDRDWMRENNALMPKMAPQRKTSVSFGSKGK